MVGVQDQRDVEGAGGLLVGLLAREHVQEVRGVAETPGRARPAPARGGGGRSVRPCVGIFAISRVAFRKLASSAFEALSGSSNESADTAVRSISMGAA